jgi:hypothetical protein
MKFAPIEAQLGFARQVLCCQDLSRPCRLNSALLQLELACSFIFEKARGETLSAAILAKREVDEAFCSAWPVELASIFASLHQTRQDWQSKQAGLIATSVHVHWTDLDDAQLLAWLDSIDHWLSDQRQLNEEY